MRIKIVSDGTLSGTKVVNADTGEMVEGVESVSVLLSVKYDFESGVRATLRLVGVPLEIVADAEVEPANE